MEDRYIIGISVLVIVLGFIALWKREKDRKRDLEGSKTEFVSLISHQLRTPPSTIKWYAEMLLREDKGVLTEDQKKYVRQIATSSQQMITLTNALLNVSRLELQSFAIEPEEVDTTKIVKQLLVTYQQQILDKKLQVHESYEENLPLLTTDPKFLTIALQNLLINAITFTPENGQITLSVTKEGKDKIHIKIIDTGCGIPKDQQSQIFTKLFRASNARMIDRKGNGLGLYIAKSIITTMGGKISCESEENKGTTFSLVLPRLGLHKRREGSRLD